MTITSEDRQTQSDAGSSAQEPSQEESPQEEHPPAPTMNPFQLVGKAIMEHASRQVANRMEAIQAVVIAFLTGQKMYIIGRPGMDTARIAGVASDFLQLPTALCHLHSQTTPAQLQGKVVRDSSRERRFAPGPLLETGERETQVAILSKLNRAPPQTLLSLSEFLSDDRRISVQGKSYPCSDIMTVIATGDLEEADSTIGELWSRFDCVLLTNSMGLEANRRTIDQRCDRSRYKDAETLIDYLRLTHNPKLTPPDGPDGECSSEQLVFLGDVIRQCRDIFETALVWVEGEPRHAAASIVDRFDDHKRWAVGVTDQTNKALIETATAISLLERGETPNAHHVWRAARWCLGGLVPRVSCSDLERTANIHQTLAELYRKEHRLPYGKHPDTRPPRSPQEPQPELNRKERRQLRRLGKRQPKRAA